MSYVEIDKRYEIINCARSFLGVKFKHQGRTNRGLDCIGLIIAVGNQCNVLEGNYTQYGPIPDGKSFIHELRKYFVRIQKENLQIGDIMSFSLPKYPCHVGIFTDKGIIHSINTRGGVVEHTLSHEMRCKMRDVYQFPLMECVECN
jgi:cell wall-associated NlpC family hydrolase